MATLHSLRAPDQRHCVAISALLLLLVPANVQAQTTVPADPTNASVDTKNAHSEAIAQQPQPTTAEPVDPQSPVVTDGDAPVVLGATSSSENSAPAPVVPDCDAPVATDAPLPGASTGSEVVAEPPPVIEAAPVVLSLVPLAEALPGAVATVPVRDFAAARQSSPTADNKSRVLGTLLDIGVPDGVMLGLAVRPWPVLRLDTAVGTNAISLGVRAGITARLPTRISPIVSVAAGHYFEGNANGVARGVAGSNYNSSPLAESIGYQFANLHTGVEFGILKSTFYLHGGMSFLHAKLHETNEALRLGQQNGDTSVAIDVKRDPTLNAWVPSIKLGFVMYWV